MNGGKSNSVVHQRIDAGLTAIRCGQFDEAIRLFRDAVAIEADPLWLDAALFLGKLLAQRNESESEDLLIRARERAVRESSPANEFTAINLLALFNRRRNPRRAWELLEPLAPPELTGAPGAHIAQRLHYKGLLAADLNQIEEAERLMFRGYQIYHECGDGLGLAEVCDSLANLLLKTSTLKPALLLARRSLQSKEKLQDYFGQAISHGTIGRILFLQAKFDEAAAAFERDRTLAEQCGDRRGTGLMLNNLGETAFQRRQFDAALDYYGQSLAMNIGPENDAHAYLGLARLHLSLGNVVQAAATADLLESAIERLTSKTGMNACLLGLRGALAARKGDSNTGETLLLQAVRGLEQAGYVLDILPWLYELRDQYQKQGRTADAVQAMARALNLLADCGADDSVSDVEKWLTQVDSPALTRLALERHFPPHLIDQIMRGGLTDRAARSLTHKQEIAVLFTDLRNYTSLSEGAAPEEILELLNDWFREATRVIRRHGGIVDKFIGDAVMALFGVPEARPDAAADAVRAALGLRNALRARNLRHRALGGREIEIGIGVHTGEAVIGFLGSHLRLSYTAIGDTVNTASRLETATKAYSGCDILISQETEDAQRAHGVAETRYMGLAELKGHSPLAVYKVVGPR